jgi:heat shock protein HslJ
MKKAALPISTLAVCAACWSCSADRKPAQAATPAVVAAARRANTFNLVGSEWLLEDLAGSGVLDSVRATLSFPEADKVAGNGSCNRFFGPAEIAGSALRLGSLGSTRIACPEAVMNQETKYLSALQAR